MSIRSASTMLGIALVGVSGGWAIAKDDDAPAEPARDRGVVTERVGFQADADVEARPILRIGGLTLRAWCTDHGPRTGSYLSVAAETAVDDAIIGSSFIQKKGARSLRVHLRPARLRSQLWALGLHRLEPRQDVGDAQLLAARRRAIDDCLSHRPDDSAG